MSAIHRLSWVVDVEGYGRRDHHAHTELQRRLRWVLTQTLLLAEVDPARCEKQERGDGVLFVLPPLIEQDRTVPRLVTGLRDVLREANREPRSGGHIRLRSALAQGIVERGATGYQGQSIIVVCYLLDAPEMKAALAESPDSDVVTIVTDDLYQDVLRQGFGQGEFRRIVLERPEKAFSATGWLQTARPGLVDPRVPTYAAPPEELRTVAERRKESLLNLLLAASSAATVAETTYTIAKGVAALQHDPPYDDRGNEHAHGTAHGSTGPEAYESHDLHDHDDGVHGDHDTHDHHHHSG